MPSTEEVRAALAATDFADNATSRRWMKAALEAATAVRAAQAQTVGKAEAFDRIVAARKAHVEAVQSYNARLEFVRAERERGTRGLNIDAEYRVMGEAAQTLDSLVRDLADAALSLSEKRKDGP